MATFGMEGSVAAGCTRCQGTVSTFEWRNQGGAFGVLTEAFEGPHYQRMRREFRLFRCAGCGRGGLGVITLPDDERYPSRYARLERFTPDVIQGVKLPEGTPPEIVAEFREGERCLQERCCRAAAAMFRSALEKTLTAAGYKPDRNTNLFKQIEAAAADGTITEARKLRAHEEVRVLGNDVLHDKWKPVSDQDAGLARDYTQGVIEDFYDHRESTLKRLREKRRVPAEDIKADPSQAPAAG